MIDVDATLEMANAMYHNVHDPDEVTRRNMIGRFYYGVFHLARDVANITSSGVGNHQAVIDYFVTRNTSVSNRLSRLRALRNQADYDLSSTVTIHELKRARKQSEYIRLALAA